MCNEFVIQTHSGFGPTHYDLMLRQADTLVTWQLSQSPQGICEGQTIASKRLADHRLAYLTYEGPVSGARGRVSILDKGTYELKAATDSYWDFRLHGRLLNSRFALRRQGENADEWEFRRTGED